jgi:hypothetical protein
MTLVGSDYLLRLAAIAVSFVGFSAMVVALRRARGAEISDLHMHFVRMFIEGGLAVAALSLVPPVLSHTGFDDRTIWRVASLIAALLFSIYLITLGRRRRLVASGRPPAMTIVNFAVSISATLVLWLNAAGVWFAPGAGPYLGALTWYLVLGGWVFLQNLDAFIRQSPGS